MIKVIFETFDDDESGSISMEDSQRAPKWVIFPFRLVDKYFKRQQMVTVGYTAYR